MKTKEELNALKEEVETLNRKLHELTDEELEQVSGGGGSGCGQYSPKPGSYFFDEYGECNACIHYQNGNCDLR